MAGAIRVTGDAGAVDQVQQIVGPVGDVLGHDVIGTYPATSAPHDRSPLKIYFRSMAWAEA
ncbi:hypothetical protein ACIHJG_37465 [Streptomyces sp. NPDC052415]|uniref:hypothetical protein n=1 Tax=Streptomyces sp. NPDC052415 TaxID=3365690 RepID=UPI0037CF8A8C